MDERVVYEIHLDNPRQSFRITCTGELDKRMLEMIDFATSQIREVIAEHTTRSAL